MELAWWRHAQVIGGETLDRFERIQLPSLLDTHHNRKTDITKGSQEKVTL
jgi:hypothetical protein